MKAPFLPLLFFVGALAIGLHPLVDPDLGWHLAGGLWFLDTGTLPTTDPFGDGGRFWLQYSWLPALLFSVVFRFLGGWTGLYVLQGISIALTACALVWFIQVLVLRGERRITTSAQLLAICGTVVLTLPLLSTVWQLRPQLFSLPLLALTVWWAATNCLTPLRVLILGAVWANVHVYWVFLPLVCGLCCVVEPVLQGRIREGIRGWLMPSLALLSGVLSPYGVDNLWGVFLYATHHSVANALIREFQPLSPHDGFVWWIGLILLGATVWLTKQGRQGVRPGLLLLHVVTLLLAFRQLKFAPLLAVTAVPILVDGFRVRKRSTPQGGAVSLVDSRVALALVLFFVVLGFSVDTSKPLPPEREELLSIARELAHLDNTQDTLRLLNHFDDGGWIQLALYLSPLRGRAVTFVDGRTLVVGEERLEEFLQVWRNGAEHCGVLERYHPHYALLKRSDPLAGVFGRRPVRCPGFVWTPVIEQKYWVVFSRTALPPGPKSSEQPAPPQ